MESVTLIGIIFIVILFIPGYFFKRFYFSGKFTKQFTSGDFAERVITSLFWGVIVQVVTFYIFHLFAEVNLSKTGSVATELMDKLSRYNFNVQGNVNLPFCIAYISSSIGMGIFLGYASHKLVRFLKIDVIVNAIRFNNEWHYLFSGVNIKSSQRLMGKGKVEAVNLDVVTDKGDGTTLLYRGLLNTYTQSHTGELETISITGAERYSKSKTGFIPVPGDCFVIPYSKVININIKYIIKKRVPFTFTGKFAIVKNVSIALFFLGFLTFPFLIPIYFYAEIKLFRTVVAVLLALFGLLLFGTIIATLFASSKTFTTPGRVPDTKENRTVKFFVIILLAAALWAVLYCLNLLLLSR